jgi:hypothetical protein
MNSLICAGATCTKACPASASMLCFSCSSRPSEPGFHLIIILGCIVFFVCNRTHLQLHGGQGQEAGSGSSEGASFRNSPAAALCTPAGQSSVPLGQEQLEDLSEADEKPLKWFAAQMYKRRCQPQRQGPLVIVMNHCLYIEYPPEGVLAD